jgi:potassium efflux system protein
MRFVELVRPLLALLLAAAIAAQTPAPQDPGRPEGLEAATLEARATAVKEQTGLDEAVRTDAAANYTRAGEVARIGDKSRADAKQFDVQRQTAPDRATAAKASLVQLGPAAQAPEPPAGATLADLEQLAAGAADAAKAATAAVTEAEKAISTRAERQPKLQQLITAANEKVTAAEAQLATPQPEPIVEPELSRRTLLRAQRYAAQQEVAALRSELAYYEGADELLTVQRDLATRRAERANQLTRQWQELVTQRRTQEAKAAQEAAERQARRATQEQQHPLIIELTGDNAALAGRRAEVATEIGEFERRIAANTERIRQTDEDFDDVKRRIERVGLTDAMGALLRERRSSLPQTDSLRREIEGRRARLSELQLERFELEDELRKLKGPDHLARLLAEAEPPIAAEDADAATVDQLLQARLSMLEGLRTDGGKLFDKLVRLDGTEQQMIGKVAEYEAYINERVLWIRSTTPIWRPRLDEADKAFAWLVDGANWHEVYNTLLHDLDIETPAWAFAALMLLLLLGLQPRFRGALTVAGEKAARHTTVSFAPTGAALALTALASLPIPLLLWFVGSRLALPTHTEFPRALGMALLDTASLLAALSLFRQVIRPAGLAENHFQWPPSTLAFYRRHLRWVLPLAIVTVASVSLVTNGGHVSWRNAVGRPALLALLGPLTALFWVMLHPRTGLAGSARPDAPDWARRFRLLWFVAGVGIPATLIVLAALGFHFTARQLAFHFGATVTLTASLFLVQDVVLRALVLTRRKIAMAQGAERRRAAAAAREQGAEPASVPVEEQLIDVHSVAAQTRSLVRSLLSFAIAIGVWVIWVDVLPALGIFKTVILWEKITLADALLASIVFAVTILAARNLPGVIQLTILQRLEMHGGERHAITTVARYVVILIGALIGFSTLGLEWSKLQWLAAGVSVGLGFGLQEVFANFVSGLIILFERPIRIGDLVTVNGIDGYVTRIRMRATTIRDYNRKELIIPNKEFITGSVVNWTLSDAVTRLIIRVGVAYGSDTEATRRILLEIAADTPGILATPKPKALFLAFGDSTLNFELRVFTADTDVWPEAIDRLNREIDRRFRDAKIEIAFPQRDLHIRSAKPIVEALMQQRPSPADRSDDAEPAK